MKVAVCCIVKLENNYIREWAQHYKNIGVDNIIMCDNNDVDGESPADVISDYITNGFVITENYRGKTSYQCRAYIECFKKYREKYDWIAFFDADELLDVENIKMFLGNNTFSEHDCVRVPWKIFDDSNIIESNGNYSFKRFKTFEFSRGCKAIVNTKSKKIGGISPHGPLNVNACDPNGDKCKSRDLFLWDSLKNKQCNVWLNHYIFKTLEEYIDNKMVRLYPDQSAKSAKSKLTIERFFTVNKITQEKIDYLKSRNIDTSFLESGIH